MKVKGKSSGFVNHWVHSMGHSIRRCRYQSGKGAWKCPPGFVCGCLCQHNSQSHVLCCPLKGWPSLSFQQSSDRAGLLSYRTKGRTGDRDQHVLQRPVYSRSRALQNHSSVLKAFNEHPLIKLGALAIMLSTLCSSWFEIYFLSHQRKNMY